MVQELFTGYINLDGVHIKDGQKNRPKAFTVIEEGKLVELRWLVRREEKRYEISKQYRLKVKGDEVEIIPECEPIMKEGIRAGEELRAYLGSLLE